MNANQRDTQLNSISAGNFDNQRDSGSVLDLKDPRAVLSLLEADQVVAAKQRTHFGRRNLSVGVRIMLWGLRTYVVIMLVLVVISVIRAIRSTP